MVKKKIQQTIRQHDLIHQGEHIVIGLSGGPDSVCLFFVLKELAKEMDFHLHAVHVNHGFRPGAAEADQAYVEDLCRKAEVDCTTYYYDCNRMAEEQGLSSEEAGRRARYEAFYQTAEKLDVPKDKVKIAVAQNANDQAETVLLRLLRGTGTDGLAGIEYSRLEKDICVIRPLLDTWREEIEAYCQEYNLLPQTDHTNLEAIYTRNKVRLQLIPYLKENFNPNIMNALTRLSAVASEDKEYLWQQAEETYSKLKVSEGVLPQKELTKLPKAIRYRVMMKALQTQGMTENISYTHLEAADKLLEKTGESRVAEFADGYQMVVRYGEAVFRAKENCYQNAKIRVQVLPKDEYVPNSNREAVFDYDKIAEVWGDSFEVNLRTRRAGDYLPMATGNKKLKKLFIDEKVPVEVREKVNFAAIGSEVLWIMEQPECGVMKNRYNPLYKLDITTKKLLKLEYICDS